MQHFVLAGHLIGLAKAKQVNTTAVERLFCERYAHEVSLNFDELVRFYLDNSLPLKTLDHYMRIFYSPTETHINLLTGSSHSSGFGMTGGHEISLTFIFLAAHALKGTGQLPDPVAHMSGRISKENIDTVCEVFGDTLLKHGFDQLEKWIQKCEELQEMEEAKEIAKADFNEQMIMEHKKKFWEGYSKSVPVLSLCLKNGFYKIDNNALYEWRYVLPKIAVIDWKYPISGAEGDQYGISLGKQTQRKILSNIVKKSNEDSVVQSGFSNAIREAVKWLVKEECKGEEGIIIAVSKGWPATELYRDESFVPSWREDVRSLGFVDLGFDGFYEGFPIARFRGEDDKEEGPEKTNESKPEKVVAVDLRGWRGVSVREEVITERKFGRVEIREWNQGEIRQAIESEKLDVKDVDKAKRNCPVDVSFYWQFSSSELPRRKIFTLKRGNVG
jgi:hypothetical protein